MAAGGEAEGGHGAERIERTLWAAASEVVEAVVERVVRQEPVPEHDRADALRREPLDDRQPLERGEELVVAAGAHDDGAAADHPLELRVHQHARVVRTVEQRVLRERRHALAARTVLAD